MGGKNSFLPCYIGAEKQQDAGSGEEGGAAVRFKFFRESKPQNVAIESDRAVQIGNVERRLQHAMQREPPGSFRLRFWTRP